MISRSMVVWLIRIGIYMFGLICTTIGIILCVKSRLGISPISSLPYVMTELLPFSFGTLTVAFHVLNICMQFALAQKRDRILVIMQIPLSLMIGMMIDFFNNHIHFNALFPLTKCMALAGSVILTAIGLVLMVNMRLIQNPPDGTVRIISSRFGCELGKVKLIYDSSIVIISLVVGLFFLHKVIGFGIATIASAILVGRAVTILQRLLSERLSVLIQ